jgi:hypothetical protein
MNRPAPQQGCIARWLYGKGPKRLVDAVDGAMHRIPAAFWRGGAVALGVAGIGAAVIVIWPKPLEYGVPEAGVLQCVAATAEVPTEYAARLFYPRCLAAKREEARIQRWQGYSEQLRQRNEQCVYVPGRAGAECPPEPPEPAE